MIDGQHYILDDRGDPVPATDYTQVIAMWEDERRVIGSDYIERAGCVIHVSTVFLAVNHQFGNGPPILWETMVFGGEFNEWQMRYSSRVEALTGHAQACKMVEGDL